MLTHGYMKRHEVLIPISKRHHDALMVAQLWKKNAPPYPGLPLDTQGKFRYGMSHISNRVMEAISGLRCISDVLMDMELEITHIHAIQASGQELLRNIAHLKADVELMHSFSVKLETYVRLVEREFFSELQEKLSQDEFAHLYENLTPALKH